MRIELTFPDQSQETTDLKSKLAEIEQGVKKLKMNANL